MKLSLHRLAIFVSGVAALGISVPVWAQTQAAPDRYDWGDHMMWNGSWYGMIFGPLFMIVFLVALIAVVLAIVRWLGGPGYGPGHFHPVATTRTPLEILKERYARGEIDKDEYEERRRVLGD